MNFTDRIVPGELYIHNSDRIWLVGCFQIFPNPQNTFIDPLPQPTFQHILGSSVVDPRGEYFSTINAVIGIVWSFWETQKHDTTNFTDFTSTNALRSIQ